MRQALEDLGKAHEGLLPRVLTAWEGWSFLPVAKDGVRAIRSWRLKGEQFLEETIDT